MLKVLLIGVALVGCKTFFTSQENDLILLRATQQRLYAGVKGGGMTTEYNITLKINTDQSLKIDSVWADNQRLSIHTPNNEEPHQPIKNIQSGDTLLLVFSTHTMDQAGNTDKQAVIHPPVPYKGAALLRYYLDSKPKYLIVQDFFELEPIYAP